MQHTDERGATNSFDIKGLMRAGQDAETPKIRRGLPPELATAVALERLSWSLAVKGADPRLVHVVSTPQRLLIRFAGEPEARKPHTLRAALQHIETQYPNPALVPADPEDRLRAAAIERVFMSEVADHVLWCLLRPPVMKGPAGYADQFMTATTLRAVESIATLRGDRPYLFGGRLSSADIAVAAVLAPAVCNDGWTWGARGWSPMSAVAGRSALVRHATAIWVRGLYARYAQRSLVAPNHTRAWVP